jgi:hypothetical protein
MQPHARVHGGRHEDGFVGGHENGRGEIVGVAAGHLGDQVGRGRSDDQQVCIARQADMADLVLVVEVEQVCEHALAGQRADGKGRHELACGPRHHHTHGGAGFAQAADQVEGRRRCRRRS